MSKAKGTELIYTILSHKNYICKNIFQPDAFLMTQFSVYFTNNKSFVE